METVNCQPLAYRPDIDGLRAFAVLSVVAYHAFPEWVKGGFIGVDVFFVISGYLIGGIILRDLEQGTFSFWNFYSRRIRRIFPALIVVLASALAFGWFALLPDEFKSLGKHVLGGSTFVSNFVLWQEAGYFDVEAKAKPLLHLWSLGIEEQFYIFFPLLLWLCFKKKLRIPFWIILLLFASFSYNIYIHGNNRTADFYSPLARVWELFAGVLCTFITSRHSIRNTIFNKFKQNITLASPRNNWNIITIKLIGYFYSILALCGILLLVVSLRCIDDQMLYPGWMALLPVIGTMCLIVVNYDNLINKYIFSNHLVVFIGKISYPFYLCHWVFISFAFIINGGMGQDTYNLRILMVSISLFIATLIYFFVEKPIRFGINFAKLKLLFLISIMILLGIFGRTIYINDGYTSRFDIPSYMDKIDKKIHNSEKLCTDSHPEWSEIVHNPCAFSKDEKKNTVALIGDSHAGRLFSGFVENDNLGFIVFQIGAAPPYIDIMTNFRLMNPDSRKKSTTMINNGFEYIIKNNILKTVILVHNPIYSFFDITDMQNININNRDIILENGMRRTFDLLIEYNKNIVVVLDNPILPFEPSKCAKRNLPFLKYDNICKFDRKIHEQNKARNWYNNILFNVLKDYPTIKTFDVSDLLCDTSYCYASKNGKLYYSDRDHLSIEGALYVADALLKFIKE